MLSCRDEEHKRFEIALAQFYRDPHRFQRIAELLPGKTLADIQLCFQRLQADVANIQEGRIQFTEYSGSGSDASEPPQKKLKDVTDRKKGVPWTEEEHRLFLMGLAKFGKGDWRNIARNYVVSRTPTQVASHAQKYFIRLNQINKVGPAITKRDKKRASIHDMAAVPEPATLPSAAAAPLAPGQTAATATAAATGPSTEPALATQPQAPHQQLVASQQQTHMAANPPLPVQQQQQQQQQYPVMQQQLTAPPGTAPIAVHLSAPPQQLLPLPAGMSLPLPHLLPPMGMLLPHQMPLGMPMPPHPPFMVQM
eukprot:jgi/Chrzof1/816/Cz01g29250.t1